MRKFAESSQLGRRDWLKAAGTGGLAAMLAPRVAASADSPAAPGTGRVSGVVFMVSDGMSAGVLTLAEAFSQLTRKRGTQWLQLINHPAAARGLMDTASASSMVTDSAAASSAWGGGQRVNNGCINIDGKGREITPIAATLKRSTKARVGLVTTSTVTHATPAGFAACVPARADENAIAPQYLERVDVILGGGSEFFSPRQRLDQRDLRAEFKKAGYESVRTRAELLAARGEKLLGTFSRGHLPFQIDAAQDDKLTARVPTLAEMTEAALTRFLAGERPFLLQVEGARIDHAAHLNDIGALLHDQIAFDDAIATVLRLTAGRNDILVVATSDHGNSNPGLQGMGDEYGDSTPFFARITRLKASHERIFSEWEKSATQNPATLRDHVLRHLDFHLRDEEAGALHAILANQNVIEWNDQLRKPEGLLGQFIGNHTGIGWSGTTHTADPTIVTAIGPQAARFAGMIHNTDVHRHLIDLLA